MKKSFFTYGNYFLFLFFTGVLTMIQTSFLFQLSWADSSPYMWIPTLIYWTLYRKSGENIIMIYLLTFLISNLTVMPISLLLIINLIISSLIHFLKLHIYRSSASYFISLSTLGALFFPVLYFLVSWLLGEKRIYTFSIFEWIIESLLTALITLPVYKTFLWFDQLTEKTVFST